MFARRSDISKRGRCRRGLTLLESLIASSILLAVVTAVTAAVTAGQQYAYEGRQRVAGAMAASSMMSRITAAGYANLLSFNGSVEDVGEMVDAFDDRLPPVFDSLGRSVEVVAASRSFDEVKVTVAGREATVRVFDDNGRTVSELSMFFPEPRS